MVNEENGIIISSNTYGKKIDEIEMAKRLCSIHVIYFCQGVFWKYDFKRNIFSELSTNKLNGLIYDEVECIAQDYGIENINALLRSSTLELIKEWLRTYTEDNMAFSEKRFIYHCRNGVLCYEDDRIVLKEHSPNFRSLWQSSIVYDPNAIPQRFLHQLLEPALTRDQIDILQLYVGQCLFGKNTSQTFLLMTGTAGAGKSTIATIIENLLGRPNYGTIRLEHTTGRFELGRLIGRSLLTAKDVAPDFLSKSGGANLKALTGSDFIEVEFKNSNERSDIRGDFNVIITSNSILRLQIASDIEAWRRRILWIDYRNAPVKNKVNNFADVLIEEEGSGILNWALEGLMKLSKNGWLIPKSKEQMRQVNFLLKSSDPVRTFVRNFICTSAVDSLPTDELVKAYGFISEHYRWDSIPRRKLELQLKTLIPEIYNAYPSNTIIRRGKRCRGYLGIQLKLSADIIEKMNANTK